MTDSKVENNDIDTALAVLTEATGTTPTTNNNSLMVLNPYLWNGLWVFDDDTVGLVREPFVLGIDLMISELVAKNQLVDAENGFILMFSSTPFPGADVELKKEREEQGGNWYSSPSFDYEGWLCPALFKYYVEAPDNLYIKCSNLPATEK